MASQTLRVILDDNTGDIEYGGGEWTLSTLEQWYQQTSNYPAFVGNGAFGSFTLTFEGTSVAFIGNIPTSGFDQFATFSIDGGTPYNATYGNVQPPAYIQWYQSPVLSDGKHTIKVDHLDGTAVDMALITVGPNTPLANKTIFVDDNDSAVQYTGHWINDSSGFNAGTLPDGQSIGNTTHRSTNVGDTMSFQFAGTSIAVYGIFSWSNIGSISATYTLDGVSKTQTYFVTAKTDEHVNADGDASNFKFFEQDLPAGNHTLIVNITDVENQTFIFDYMVYTPSFSTLATMPNLTITSTSNTSTTTTPTVPNDPSTGTGAGTSQVNFSSSKKPSPLGAIVGGVVGVVALIALAVLMTWYLLKRNRRLCSQVLDQNAASNPVNNVAPQMAALPTVPPGQNVSPFVLNTDRAGFAPVSDVKRDRIGQEHPISRQPRSHNTSIDSGQRNLSSAASSSARTDGLEYVPFQSVPPAYEALSTHLGPSSVDPVPR